MEFFADWHTHSRYSDGRGTIEDNVIAAVNRGLEQLAITDHGPGNISAGVKNSQTYLKIAGEIQTINLRYPEIEVKTGAEADIISVDGEIDLPPDIADGLDILIVGMHPYVWPSSVEGVWSVVGENLLAQVSSGAKEKARAANTKALIEAINRYDVDFISHPNLQMPVDVAELARACAAREVALEINTGHHYDKEEMVSTAAREGVNFVVSSDAHFPDTVGELASGGVLLEKLNVPSERVLNAREPRH